MTRREWDKRRYAEMMRTHVVYMSLNYRMGYCAILDGAIRYLESNVEK